MYAWKDWYKALCGLIMLMGIIEHPDMPKSILGIQGLNPWNLVFAMIFLSWLSNRKKENLKWDAPKHINVLFLIYLVVILISSVRMMLDPSGMNEWLLFYAGKTTSTSGIISEHFINTIKWVLPGLMLFDGCRSRKRFIWAIISLLVIYMLLGLQVIKWMPLSGIGSGEALTRRSLKILSNEVGFHRVNLAMMLSGASWAMFSITGLIKEKRYVKYILFLGVVLFFSVALTGGRTGLVTWVAIGLILGYFRWKKLIILAPVFFACILLLVPAVQERLFQGIGGAHIDTNVRIDEVGESDGKFHLYTITAGRNIAWPFVIDKIGDKFWMGYGREAMMRTGLSLELFTQFNESFPHPHNLYLQWFFDTGLIGFLPVFLLYMLFIKYSKSLFKDSRHKDFVAIGGITLSLLLALLIAGFGSQSFYPREGAFGMWCAIGLMLRVYVNRSRLENGTAKKLWRRG